MSFFPIQVWLAENTHSLWIYDSPLMATDLPKPEAILNALSQLLANIEKAAQRGYSCTSYSERFSLSPRHTYLLTATENQPSRLQHIQRMLIFVNYIQEWASYNCPSLFISSSSLGSQLCIHTIWTLQQMIISHQREERENLLEGASTSTAVTHYPFVSSLPVARPQQSVDNILSGQIGSPIPKKTSSIQKRHLRENDPSDDSDSASIDEVFLDSQEPSAKKQKILIKTPVDLPEERSLPSPLPTPLGANWSTTGCSLLSPSRLEESSSLEGSDEEEIIIDSPHTPLPVLPIMPRRPVSAGPAETASTSAIDTSDTLLDTKDFIAISIHPLSQLVTIIPKKMIRSVTALNLFLEKVKNGLSCSSYTCSTAIPEIDPRDSSDKDSLLKALYSSVLRNVHFFKVHHPLLSSFTGISYQNTLSLINKEYCKYLKIKENALNHHTDLTALQIIPKPITCSFTRSWIVTLLRQTAPQDLIIRTHAYSQQQKSAQLSRIKHDLTKTLAYFKQLRTQKYFRIKCYDNSIPLSHSQEENVPQKTAIEIFRKILQTNNQHYNNLKMHFYKSTTIMIQYHKAITALLSDLEKLLDEWNEGLSSDEDDEEIATTSQIVASPSKQSSDSTSSSEKAYFRIFCHPTFNTFTIQTIFFKKRPPSPSRFTNFITRVEECIKKTGYSYRNAPLPGIATTSSNPKTILHHLFLITCQYASVYQKRTPQNKLTHTLLKPSIDALFSALKNIDKAYCEQTSTVVNSDKMTFHPDLQPFVEKYHLITFLETISTAFSFTFCHINVDISLAKKIIILQTKTYTSNRPSYIIQDTTKTIRYACTNLLRIMQHPSAFSFTVTSTDTSHTQSTIHTGSLIPRNTILNDCKAILSQIRDDFIHTTASLRVPQTLTYNTALRYMNFTISFLTEFLETGLLPTTPIPSDLQAHIHVFLSSARCDHKKFLIRQQEIFSQMECKHAHTLESSCRITSKILKQHLHNLPSLSSKAKLGYYEKSKTSEISKVEDRTYLIPFIYRGLQQNLLQIQQLLQKKLNTKILSFAPKTLINSIEIIRSDLVFLQTVWEENCPNEDLPGIADLLPEYRRELYFTEERVIALRRELQIFANSLIGKEADQYAEFLFSEKDFYEEDLPSTAEKASAE